MAPSTLGTFAPTVAFVCELELHSHIMYTSRDLGRLQVTEKEVISNYALTYALGRALAWDEENSLERNGRDSLFPKSRPQPEPSYIRDFTDLRVYVTPARSLFSWHRTKSYNTLPEVFQKWSTKKQATYAKVVPAYGRYAFIGVESRYLFVVFSEVSEIHFPRYIRLGRFRASAEVTLLGTYPVRRGQGSFESLPVHRDDVLPSLDMWGDLILLGKRHAVLLRASYSGDWWLLTERKVTDSRGERVQLEDGLPIGVFYGQRFAAQASNNS